MEAGLLLPPGRDGGALLASAFALVNERNGVSIPGELRSTTPVRGVAARRSLAMWASDE